MLSAGWKRGEESLDRVDYNDGSKKKVAIDRYLLRLAIFYARRLEDRKQDHFDWNHFCAPVLLLLLVPRKVASFRGIDGRGEKWFFLVHFCMTFLPCIAGMEKKEQWRLHRACSRSR